MVLWESEGRSVPEEPLDSSAEMLDTARGALVESMGRAAVVPVIPDMMVSTTRPTSARLWAKDAQRGVKGVGGCWSAP